VSQLRGTDADSAIVRSRWNVDSTQSRKPLGNLPCRKTIQKDTSAQSQRAGVADEKAMKISMDAQFRFGLKSGRQIKLVRVLLRLD
jgi:hypothetical protein